MVSRCFISKQDSILTFNFFRVSLDDINFPDRLNWVIEDPDKAKKRSLGRRLVRILKE